MNGRSVNDPPAEKHTAENPASRPQAGLARLMAAIGCSVVQFWLAVPLTSLVLSHRGIGSGSIGLFAMTPWLAVLLLLPLTPRLVRQCGAISIFRSGMILGCAAMILLMLTGNLAVWFAANFLNGAGAALRWVVSDTLVVAAAPARHRGRILGIYETVLGGCLLAAPFLLSCTGSDGLLPFAIAAVLPLLAILPTLGLKAPPMTVADIRLTELTAIAARYALPLLTILLCGIVACSSYSLFPIYGRALGLGERESALWMALFGFGAVACQYAIGWLCDRWQHDLVHRALIGLVTAGLLLLPALDAGGPLLWLFGFFFGGAVTGLYTVTMYLSGSVARPGELLTLIMAVTLFYTLGSIAGPVMAGWAMEILPPHGLPVSLAAASLLVIAAMILLQRRPAPQAALQASPPQ
ncbi:MAG TPA: MFS transporter [Verrucomicrobiae bacterium]|nr:MFS transporter [Verrucomicrobiae bacterium]